MILTLSIIVIYIIIGTIIAAFVSKYDPAEYYSDRYAKPICIAIFWPVSIIIYLIILLYKLFTYLINKYL